ncbi:MerR family transcriptional regulator [Paenibacillus sp. sgz302251]|uniref:MerR family transcriptional regulator n=1 Tax=Paenibacillus sp. sgz302251 TaxID=3414493 RepID=UPI003C79D309
MTYRLYTIKEAAMRTGLSTQLIRKWEERYEAVAPQRMANGYRGYTKEDIDTLLWLKREADKGVPIGMAVLEWKGNRREGLDMAIEREGTAGKLEQWQNQETSLSNSYDWNQPIEHLLQCFTELDLANAQRFYEQLLATHPLEYLLLNILEPTLVELGERWARGEISEYQEHFGSHFIRDRMLAIRSLFRPADGSPLLVTACGPGERHELGILIFGFFAQQEGFKVIYLGPSPSEKGMFDCLDGHRPVAFTFSYSIVKQLEKSIPFLVELDKQIEEGNLATHVFIGGRAVQEDGLLEGTKRVHLITGDGKSAIQKIKTRLLME